MPFVKPSDFKQSINNLDSYNTYLSNDGFNSVLVTCIGTIGKVAIVTVRKSGNSLHSTYIVRMKGLKP